MNILNRLFCSKRKPRKIEESKNSHHIPLRKYYAFNETGNVMVCTTNKRAEVVNNSLKYMFSDMSIFFAAMTKAIVSSGNESGNVSSIYNSDAIMKILDKSELFVEAKQESTTVSSSEVGDKMSKELTEKLLGREFGESKLSFSRGLFHSMAAAPKVVGGSGSIFFVCESILDLPMVSAVVVKLNSSKGKGKQAGKTVEARDMSEILDIKEEEGTNSIVREWRFDKKTYLFISPRSISGANFPALGDDVEFETLVASLIEHLV